MRRRSSSRWTGTIPLVAALWVGLGSAGLARADRAERDALERRAAAALDDLRYEEAYPLYEQLERMGGNRLDEIREIYRRLAEIAASMRRTEEAVSRYEKLLAVEPGFQPAAGSPDVFRAVLDLARLRPGALEPVEATATAGGESGRAIDVMVSRDPLGMVAGAGLYRYGEQVAIARATGAAPWRLAVPGSGPLTVQVILEDQHGNQLMGLPPIEIAGEAGGTSALSGGSPAGSPTGGSVARAGPAAPEGRSWYARPAVWLGVSAAAAAGVGLALGATVADRQDALDAILADSRNHLLSEAEVARDRLEQRALHANLAFVAAGALAAGAVIALLLEPDPEPRSGPALTVTAGGDGALVGIGGTF